MIETLLTTIIVNTAVLHNDIARVINTILFFNF